MMRGRKLRATAVLAAAALTLAGCGGAPAVKLPPKSTVPAPSPSFRGTATAGDASGQVVAAYTASWVASDKAERSGSTAAARVILAPYLTGGYLATVLAKLPAYWAADEAAAGYMTAHVKSVYVRTGTAVVIDCQDASHHLLTRTGKAVPGTTGPARAQLYASLQLVAGSWRVASVTYTGASCSP